MKSFNGALVGTGLRIAVIVSRFNNLIGDKLLEGAVDTLTRHGVAQDDITVVKVPGAFEIPLAARELAKTTQYDAIVTLGAVIRGATAHFDYVAGPMASNIAAIGVETGVPVLFGVLTVDTIEQALERSGSKAGNKGSDAALAAIEMANLLKAIHEV